MDEAIEKENKREKNNNKQRKRKMKENASKEQQPTQFFEEINVSDPWKETNNEVHKDRKIHTTKPTVKTQIKSKTDKKDNCAAQFCLYSDR